MAQTLVVISGENPFIDGNIPYQLILDWISAAGGTVSLDIASTYAAQLASKSACPISVSAVKGALMSVETAPGANGDLTTALPTSYDLSILDEYGYDILAGNGAGRSASAAEKIVPSAPLIINSELTLTISSAGDTKQGRIILEFEEVNKIVL